MRFSPLPLALLLLLGACADKGPIAITTQPQKEASGWSPATFASLPSWGKSPLAPALSALTKNCALIERKSPSASFAGTSASDWKPACAALASVTPSNEAEIKRFFETHFTPYLPTGATSKDGLFTGYYEPLLEASREKTGPYQTILWQKPTDLVAADLGSFDSSLAGKKLVGKIKGQKFVPYDERSEIVQGSLEGRAKPLFYVKDPIAAFFLQIQGSGIVQTKEGETLRVAYDGQNGKAYTAIGKTLLDQGSLERPVTLPKIRDWLKKNPTQAQTMMNKNASFVFFKLSNSDAAKGAMGLPLTPGASLAVDPSFVPLGSLLWLAPAEDVSPRLVVAQDTGGAIKGRIRGDLFLGPGPDAEELAGKLQSPGLYYLLWPTAARNHAP